MKSFLSCVFAAMSGICFFGGLAVLNGGRM